MKKVVFMGDSLDILIASVPSSARTKPEPGLWARKAKASLSTE
jgi:hypothetical protein